MKPAARVGDMHTCPMVSGTVPHVGGPVLPPCATTVTAGGIPAARVGDRAVCVGPPDTIVMGSLGVFVEGKPFARLGDRTAHGGVIVAGCPTVLVGDIGGGGAASLQGLTMSAAKKAGAPFTKMSCDGIAAPASKNVGSSLARPKKPVRINRKLQRTSQLKKALQAQRKMLNAKEAELKRWDEPAKKNFEQWFGSRDEDARKTILRRIQKTKALNRTYDVKNFRRIAGPDADGTYAEVYATDPGHKIFLGKPFDRAPLQGVNSQAGTLSHEMSHFHDIGGTNDFVYGTKNCKDLAKRRPDRALYNADSFEYYLENAP